ncbi:MAG: AraC family transcriptional regulator [Clostridia bacterium]|nr:AraC family transcriptional regulator [Clostridia bacterium]
MKTYYPNKGDKFLFNNYLPMKKGELLYVGMSGITHPRKGYRIARNQNFGAETLYVLEYVTSGAGSLRVGDVTHSVKAGDFYMVSTQDDHEYYPDPDNPFSKIWINLYGSYIEKLAEAFDFPNPVICRVDVSEEMKKLHELTEGKTPDDVGAMTDKICVAVFELLYKVYGVLKSAEARDSKFDGIINYISSNITCGISVKQICAENYISQPTLFRMFEKKLGMSPNEYISSERIRIIKLMLKKTDMKIKEISEKMHFSDYVHFYRFFCIHTGMTPSEYRKSK